MIWSERCDTLPVTLNTLGPLLLTGLISICCISRFRRTEEREKDGEMVSHNTYLSIMFAIFYRYTLRCPKIIIIVMSKSLITDHHKNIIIKEFEILQELPKCNKHKVRKYNWKNGTDRFAWHKVATYHKFIKNTVSAKRKKAKHNKMRYTCNLSNIRCMTY